MLGKPEPFLSIDILSQLHVGHSDVVGAGVMIEVFPQTLEVEVKGLVTFVQVHFFLLLVVSSLLFCILDHETYLASLCLVSFAEPIFWAFEDILVYFVIVGRL